MGYFQVRYDPRVVIYNCKASIRLTTDGLNRAKDPRQSYKAIYARKLRL